VPRALAAVLWTGRLAGRRRGLGVAVSAPRAARDSALGSTPPRRRASWSVISLLDRPQRASGAAHGGAYRRDRLITGILLDCRGLVARGQSAVTTVRQFYIRRFLRIVPAYYGVLLVTWLLGVPDVRATIKWDLLYLTNIYFVRANDWLHVVSHLWSLAVEEQFYLVWPAVILFVPRRRLRATVLAVAAAGVVFRAAWLASDLPPMAVWALPFGSLDSLAVGSLLALGGARRCRAIRGE